MVGLYLIQDSLDPICVHPHRPNHSPTTLLLLDLVMSLLQREAQALTLVLQQVQDLVRLMHPVIHISLALHLCLVPRICLALHICPALRLWAPHTCLVLRIIKDRHSITDRRHLTGNLGKIRCKGVPLMASDQFLMVSLLVPNPPGRPLSPHSLTLESGRPHPRALSRRSSRSPTIRYPPLRYHQCLVDLTP